MRVQDYFLPWLGVGEARRFVESLELVVWMELGVWSLEFGDGDGVGR